MDLCRTRGVEMVFCRAGMSYRFKGWCLRCCMRVCRDVHRRINNCLYNMVR